MINLQQCAFPNINLERCEMPVAEILLIDEKPYGLCAEHERWIIAGFDEADWNPIDG